ncbi:MAG: Spy/CpxP family protein refolding chaperone [Betaproteobacteria bacterium]|nr:Spy/CpxP family protein refolding chaperone [Betaproteobacteria bacterium]
MKTAFVVSAVTAACLSTFAAAQMGPGMMQGQGPGHGMMHGQGPGPGPGAGMMGQPGCPMGPGMQGQGMRHGPGMGGGMMGMHGEGAGAMDGARWAALGRLNLSDEQRTKVTTIRRDLQRKNHALMGSMHEIRWQAEDARKSAEFDEAAARKRYDAGAAIRKQMFEARLEAHKKIQDVLTKEQREQLGKDALPVMPGLR